MRAKERRALEKAAQTVAERSKARGVAVDAAELAQRVADDVDGILEQIYKPRYASRRSDEAALQPLLGVYDIALAHSCDLAVLGALHPNEDRFLIWPQVKLEDFPDQGLLFEVLTGTLAQLVQAVRFLSTGGFEGPARMMARVLVEHADLLLAVVLDEKVLRYYAEWPLEPEARKRHWRKHLAPAVIRRTLDTWSSKIGVPAESAEEARVLREETYEWFSAFVHGHPAAATVASHTMPLGADFIHRTAVFGSVGEAARATLQRVLFYLTGFYWILDSVLVSVHGWAHPDAPDDLDRYLQRSVVLRTLMTTGIDEEPVKGHRKRR